MIRMAMMASMAVVQVADLLTTNAALARGSSELNPIMAWAQHDLGYAWAVPKLALAALVIWLLSPTRKLLHMMVLVGLAGIAVVNNALVLATLA